MFHLTGAHGFFIRIEGFFYVNLCAVIHGLLVDYFVILPTDSAKSFATYL